MFVTNFIFFLLLVTSPIIGASHHPKQMSVYSALSHHIHCWNKKMCNVHRYALATYISYGRHGALVPCINMVP